MLVGEKEKDEEKRRRGEEEKRRRGEEEKRGIHSLAAKESDCGLPSS